MLRSQAQRETWLSDANVLLESAESQTETEREGERERERERKRGEREKREGKRQRLINSWLNYTGDVTKTQHFSAHLEFFFLDLSAFLFS